MYVDTRSYLNVSTASDLLATDREALNFRNRRKAALGQITGAGLL